MVNYYRTNVNLLVYPTDVGLCNNFRLSDFDDMKPYQRDAYILLISEKFGERVELLKKRQGK